MMPTHNEHGTPQQDGETGRTDLIRRLLDKESAFRAFIRRRIDDPAIAEDLLQQALMRAIERHHAVRDEESVVPWFYRVLRNTVIDYYRSQEAESRRDEALLQEMTHLGEDQEVPDDDLQRTACQCLYSILPAMKDSYTEVLRLIDLEGGAVQDVAKQLKLTPNNLAVRLHRARHALRTRLEEACGMCSTHGCLDCSCQ